MAEDLIKKILQASVYDVAEETPLEPAAALSRKLENRILLKREDLQPVFSFKLRGAYNKIRLLSDEEKKRGVIAASAGNHAQGVALAAGRLGLQAMIVMPETTPVIKVKAVRQLGGEVLLFGDSYDEACDKALQLAEQKGMTFVHPYDDIDVIAGQGTIGMEILRQHTGPLDAIFVPVGGGGLIAGLAAYAKFVRPEVKVIGVEPEEANSLFRALKAGRRVRMKQVGLFADGVAVKQVGKETFHLARKFVDEVVCVSTDEICAAIRDIFEDTRSIAEPAGALAVAGMKKYLVENRLVNQTVVAVESGANMNFDRLRYVAERSAVGEQSEALFAVTIPEKPGSFLNFCETLGKRSITEFNYRFHHGERAHVFVGIGMEGGEKERHCLTRALEKNRFSVVDLTENEIAKEHIRYMVGGHAEKLSDERVFRFEFPERPGALLQFLRSMGGRWNISLFHYRNHGAAYGQVLMGIQVPRSDLSACRNWLSELGYSFEEVTDNSAYRLFAGGGVIRGKE